MKKLIFHLSKFFGSGHFLIHAILKESPKTSTVNKYIKHIQKMYSMYNRKIRYLIKRVGNLFSNVGLSEQVFKFNNGMASFEFKCPPTMDKS